MNSIFIPQLFRIAGEELIVTGEELTAIKERQRLELGRRYSLGLEGRGRYSGELFELTSDRACFRGLQHVSTLERRPLKLVVGIARPQTVKKVLHVAASYGVPEVLFIRSERAEKSYFQSAGLLPSAIRSELVLGVEQGWDYELPVVRVVERFKAIVQDELAATQDQKVLLSTRNATSQPRFDSTKPMILAVGPEAGWSEFEEEFLIASGFVPQSLGPRALRVEVALAVGLGYLVR